MTTPFSSISGAMPGAVSRRQFVAGTMAAATSMALAASASGQAAPATAPGRKIKLGLVGCGGRGSLVGNFFKQHGGYELFAVADYFPEVVDKAGTALGVDPARRFSGLGGYKKLIACGVEAVALENIPSFMPDQATAAVAAGCHVYMAKPVAADVPGCLQIAAAGELATQKKQCFLVDYQMPTDPVNIDIVQRIRDGGVGKVLHLATSGINHGFEDPPKTATLESRLQRLIWVNDIALGCDYIGNYDIHAIDAALWVLDGARPVAASGASQVARPGAHGDGRGVCSVVYEYADGTVHNHFGLALPDLTDDTLNCRVYGTTAHALITYWGKSFLRGGPKQHIGAVENLYNDGIVRNIATFHENITNERFTNPTVRRAVDSALACILGREAAARHTRLTMEELLKENKRLEVDVTGLKV